jgi:two-component system LytT family sensor kinase
VALTSVFTFVLPANEVMPNISANTDQALWPRTQRNALLAITMVIAVLLPVAGHLLWGPAYFSDGQIFLLGSLLNLCVCMIALFINRWFHGKVARFYPEPNQSVQRVLSWFGLYAIVNLGVSCAAIALYHQASIFGYVFEVNPALWCGVGIMAGSLMGAGLTEMVFAFGQWKIDQQELFQMEQKQLQTELDIVKQQVNPHFLFNCLNSLSVLISEVPATAEKFVDEMSKVYRYLLNVYGPDKEHTPVTLDTELRFIRSYMYLLETRYDSGIIFSISVEDTHLGLHLPPLALQLLLDNAIRYNVVSADQPLRISVKTTLSGDLEVKNTLNKRIVTMQFNDTGLSSLLARYKVMFSENNTIGINEDASHFTVTLPLIRP